MIHSQRLTGRLYPRTLQLHTFEPAHHSAGRSQLGRALAPIDQMVNAWKGFVALRFLNNALRNSKKRFEALEEKSRQKSTQPPLIGKEIAGLQSRVAKKLSGSPRLLELQGAARRSTANLYGA